MSLCTLTVNRLLRGLGVIAMLAGTSPQTFAACEAELKEEQDRNIAQCIVGLGQAQCSQRFRPTFEEQNKEHQRAMIRGTYVTTGTSTEQQLWFQEANRLLTTYTAYQKERSSPQGAFLISRQIYEVCMWRWHFKLTSLQSVQPQAPNQQNQIQNRPSQSQPNQTDQSQSQQSSQQNQAAQQQSQQAQQQAQQAQDAARVAQTRADQARQGKRRQHEPENEASHCIQPDFGGLYGSMKNTCNFKVWYTYCGFRPKEGSWLTGMSCEKQSFGSDSVSPGRTSASHTKGVEAIHWIACKEPAWALDAEFVPGQGIKGRCYTVGGK